ncbi:MAG: DUF1587 domain-containing protein, partial [Planctomycetes bacterium]|nr:DUF1587 domain-containing protein [Planctomycetota bacterium]
MDMNAFPIRFAASVGLLTSLFVMFLNIQPSQPSAANQPARETLADQYATTVQPVLKKFCLDCHSTKEKKGSLDLERFVSIALVRKDLKPWQQMIEMLEAGEMPPKENPQPTADERKKLIAWIRGFLDAEARARAGDPGHVPLRRLSNAEYDATIRDLTGVDLRPTREFPADGAAGEGFTNAAEALTDISPALLTKYLNAAKEIAEHAVLLPDGFTFSPTKTRRDWTNESVSRLRKFYAEFAADGRLPLQPYLAATVRHRDALTAKKITVDEVAAKEKLNAKYLGVLWQTLTDRAPSYPLDLIRARWREAAEKDVPALLAEITTWQTTLWKSAVIGSYRYGNNARQVANDPVAADTQPLKIAVKPAPGQNEVVLYLSARDASPDANGMVIWQRPRFEGVGKSLLLRDYAQFGPAYEIDVSTVFTDTSKYLTAALEAANDRKQTIADVARTHGLEPAILARWIEVLAIELPKTGAADPKNFEKSVPAVTLELLDEKSVKSGQKPAINGWHRKGIDLPLLVTNSSDAVETIPGKIPPHKVAVHPTPKEFVAVAWKSPMAGSVRVSSKIAHAHPACGNGVAWWLQHRRGDRAIMLTEGVLDLGKEVTPPSKMVTVEKGDLLVLAVDARNGNHVCDMTEIALTITEADKPNRTWDLAADVADNVLDGNPHADKQENKDTWSFVRGPSKATGKEVVTLIPLDSVLGHWREAAIDPIRQTEAAKLAEQVEKLLTSPRPAKEKDPDRVLYDNLVSADGSLLKGLDLSRFAKPRPKGKTFGLAKERFGHHPDGKPLDDASLAVAANTVVEVRLPAVLFRDREFVVEGKLDGASDRLMHFQVTTTPPTAETRWDGKSAVVASPNGSGFKRILQGYADFRKCFPTFICFSQVIPTDEVVCLKMYHREDEPLSRLFLNEDQQRRIDHLWNEHRFISQQPVAENNYLPQFIGFVTQDQPKELLAYFEGQRDAFRKRAEDFEKDSEAAIPKQLDVLLDFASRAYRRPLLEKEKADLLALYQTVRKKGSSHDEAFRGMLSRILVSPAFLFRIEQAPTGTKPAPVNDWELASRLSYFLWSSAPDDALRKLAAAGKLHEPNILAEQTQRMLKDDRTRSLAIEFGTQWIHVRGFDDLKEKNE